MTFNVQLRQPANLDPVKAGEKVIVALDVSGTADTSDFSILSVDSKDFDVTWNIVTDEDGKTQLVVELLPDGKGADNLQGLPFDVTVQANSDAVADSGETLSFDIATAVKVDAVTGDVIEDYGTWESNDEIHFTLNEFDATITGSSKADSLIAEDGSQHLLGANGDDLLVGGAGDDALEGGKGDDQLFGGEGDDVLAGDDGNDVLYGDVGNDILNGGAGDDVFYASSSDTAADIDNMYGDAGDDLFVFGDFQGTANVYGDSDVSPDAGSWVDMIEIDVVPDAGDVTGDWTLSIEGQPDQTFNPAVDDGSVTGEDMSGTISTDDGGTINFDDIDKIEW